VVLVGVPGRELEMVPQSGVRNRMNGRKNATAVPRVNVNSEGNGISRANQGTLHNRAHISRCSKFSESVFKIQS